MTLRSPKQAAQARRLDAPFVAPQREREIPLASGSGSVRAYVADCLRTTVPLAVLDLVGLWGALAAVLGVFRLLGVPAAGLGIGALVPLAWMLPLFFGLQRLYPGSALAPAVEMRRMASGLTSLFGAYSVLAYWAFGPTLDWASFAFAAWGCALWTVPVLRDLGRSALARTGVWGRRTIVVGNTLDARSTYDALRKDTRSGLAPTAFVDALDSAGFRARLSDELGRRAYFVAIVVSERGAPQLEELLRPDVLPVPNRIVVAPRLDAATFRTGESFLGSGVAGMHVRDGLLNPVARVQKRTLDLILATVLGLCFLPLFFVIALAIRVTAGSPVLFRHARVGKHGMRIHVWKFCSMVQNGDEVLERHLAADPAARAEWEENQKLVDDPRVTRIGRILRKTSLDELPQIWNVLRGEMSLVGPRPIVESEIVKYGSAFDLYSQVTPGLTGLWQVSGRNSTTYDYRVQLDGYYVRNWSVWLELHILVRTARVVIGGGGAS